MIDPLKSLYDDMWTRSKALLSSGEINVDPPPVIGERRWGLSAVIRPTGGVNDRLAAIGEDLHRLLGDDQLIYSQENLHSTFRSIEDYRGDISSEDDALARYVEILAAVCKNSPPIQIHYHGLTATTTGILAQGFPVGEAYQSLREKFHEQLHVHGFSNGPEAENIRRSAHASLAVFTHKPLPGLQLAEYIEANREIEIGLTVVKEIEVVFYRRGLTTVSLQTLAKIPLNR